MKNRSLFTLPLLLLLSGLYLGCVKNKLPTRQSLPKPLGSVAALAASTSPLPQNWPNENADDRYWPFMGSCANRKQASMVSFPSAQLEQKWTYDLGSHTYQYRSGTNLWSVSAIAFPIKGETHVAFGAYDRKVHCLNALTGKRAWRFTTGDEVIAAPAYGKGTIVVASSDRSIYGLSLTGERQWVNELLSWGHTVAPATMSSPVIMSLDGNDYALFGAYLNDFGRSGRKQDGLVSAIALKTGATLWSYVLRHDEIFGPALSAIQGKPIAFYVTGDGVVSALDCRDGRLAWQVILDDRVRGCPTVAKINGKTLVLVTTKWGMLWALDGATGTKVWSYRAGHMADCSAAVYKDTVFFGTYDRCMHAVNGKTGEALWKYTTKGVVLSSPAIGTIKGKPVIFFSSLDDYLYCLDVAKGKKLWSFKTGKLIWPYFKRGDAVFGSPILCRAKDRAVLVHCGHDGKIYAFTSRNNQG